MDNQSFLAFVKWYFDLVSDKFYGRASNATRFNISKKERLIAIVVGYCIFIGSGMLLFVQIDGNYILFIMAILISVILLFMGRFSLLYYILIYNKCKKFNRSLNDRVIIEESIQYKTSNRIRQAISRHYKIIDLKGSLVSLRFILKNKSGNELNNIIVLKITSNKIILNNKVISEKRLNDVNEFEELIKGNDEGL